VMVSIRKSSGNVIVSIVVTGRGIDPSIKNTLFEKFVSQKIMVPVWGYIYQKK
jgi:signal transduction histidine kinase